VHELGRKNCKGIGPLRSSLPFPSAKIVLRV
jgi:hypothetical protein